MSIYKINKNIEKLKIPNILKNRCRNNKNIEWNGKKHKYTQYTSKQHYV